MKLLVYIPCWKNYPDALSQIDRLRDQYKQIQKTSKNLELELGVSVNAVTELDSRIKQRFEDIDLSFTHFQTNIADVNINLGFMEALRRGADFLWIVSPDDRVSEGALSRIVEHLVVSSGVDCLVADEESLLIRSVHLKSEDLDFRLLSEASFGMITGVVYRVSSFKPYLHYGVQACFTGWGQLAVILGGSRSKLGISGLVVPSGYLYERGDPKDLNYLQKQENLRKYAHSFFGFLVLIALVSKNPKREIRRWVYSNFTKIGSYNHFYVKDAQGYSHLADMKRTAQILVRESDPITRLLYSLSSAIPLYKLWSVK
jgi:hypothetical protein